MKKSTYLNVVKYSAIYDVVMTFAFAFPVLVVWNIDLFSSLHVQYGFSGSVPEFQALHLFFVNLMGSVVLVWSAIRLYKPQAIFGLYDSFARFMFSFNMLYYLLIHNVTSILWVLFVPELAWGLLQFFAFFMSNKTIPKNASSYNQVNLEI
ncbi:hypothetical protein DBZ36_11745 [Alginatibacterium sediminis]|uniref:Uncharacterized protein n=1 Tax=Alginatibacterium sediminis TaxID=2164068 RepID=A0A420EB53_9ALTE|nr:hypothetical protein [Alginatibacterium sediminis]RKF17915.1 hypothetical protein DBZ36_11745 [Alginatibacterium sediminis]